MPATTPNPPHWLLILNGKSAADEALRAAVRGLRVDGVRVDVRVTWEAGDAQRYVDEGLATGVTTIVACGGDGTLSEVAAALAHCEADATQLPSVGLVPLGTANDFATAAELPLAPAAALALVRESAPVAIDLLRIEAADDDVHWCANLASGGFGTDVTVETDEGLKKMLGGLAYLVTGIARLGRIEPVQARIEADDFAWEGGFIALGLGNGRQAGGGQQLCPDACIDDGLLDVTIVPELAGEVAATVTTLVAEGRQAALERVAVRHRCRQLRIAAPTPVTLNLDGEPCAANRFDVTCAPARLRMHLPAGCPLLCLPGNPEPLGEPVAPAPDLDGAVLA
jgi:lipid kinase YegS